MPCFVTFEGIEGCGKSTQAQRLADFVRSRYGVDVVVTREPGGTELTRPIRALLADPNARLDARAELLLFLADRAQHVASVIAPKLAEGALVICDRYSDSTLAYQGYARGHPLDLLEPLNAFASRDVSPDLTLWIDCDVDLGLRRATKRTGGPGDRFECEPLEFHRRVRDGFAALHRRFPQRIVRIDGEGSIDAVAARVRDAATARLGATLEALRAADGARDGAAEPRSNGAGGDDAQQARASGVAPDDAQPARASDAGPATRSGRS